MEFLVGLQSDQLTKLDPFCY